MGTSYLCGPENNKTHLMALFQVNPGKLAPKRFNEERDDRVAVASAGPYAFAPHSTQITRLALHHSIFTGLMLKQQCQALENGH